MSFDIIGSMEREVGKKRKKRSNPNELGMLPVDDRALENIFGGVRSNGKSKKGFMDFGDIDIGMERMEDDIDRANGIEPKRKVFREPIREEGFIEGVPVGNLGEAFNGRFKNIGGGFIESVNAGSGSIDFDKGSRSGDVVSPVFRTGESFGFKRGKLERVADKEARQIARERRKRAKAEAKARKKSRKTNGNGNGNGEVSTASRGETAFQVIRRKIKERKERKESGNGFSSQRIELGRGTTMGAEGKLGE